MHRLITMPVRKIACLLIIVGKHPQIAGVVVIGSLFAIPLTFHAYFLALTNYASTTPLRPAEVIEVQTRLAAMGFTPDAADGVVGAQTREAVLGFRMAIGLEENSELTRQVLEELRKGTPSPKDRATVLNRLARRAMENDDLNGAVRLFQASQKLLPDADTSLSLGDILLKQGHISAARLCWEEARRLGRETDFAAMAEDRLQHNPPDDDRCGRLAVPLGLGERPDFVDEEVWRRCGGR